MHIDLVKLKKDLPKGAIRIDSVEFYLHGEQIILVATQKPKTAK